jgi:hypothetical protein
MANAWNRSFIRYGGTAEGDQFRWVFLRVFLKTVRPIVRSLLSPLRKCTNSRQGRRNQVLRPGFRACSERGANGYSPPASRWRGRANLTRRRFDPPRPHPSVAAHIPDRLITPDRFAFNRRYSGRTLNLRLTPPIRRFIRRTFWQRLHGRYLPIQQSRGGCPQMARVDPVE